jgi:Nucleotidyl transferase AbiEii toxin, Type IV TA system
LGILARAFVVYHGHGNPEQGSAESVPCRNALNRNLTSCRLHNKKSGPALHRPDTLDKDQMRAKFDFVRGAAVLQDAPDTLVVRAKMPSGLVKISFFGGVDFGRVNDPLQTCDGTLLVASLDDLMATKLKATLDRAEAKDYRDIAEMISAGVSLSAGLSAFKQMFDGEPAQVLRAIGYFEDGDLTTLSAADRDTLRKARDQIGQLPGVVVRRGSLTGR